jgi:hypothetical protein
MVKLIEKETLALGCSRGGVYPRPQTTTIIAMGGDKPRHYFISRLNEVSYEHLLWPEKRPV